MQDGSGIRQPTDSHISLRDEDPKQISHLSEFKNDVKGMAGDGTGYPLEW